MKSSLPEADRHDSERHMEECPVSYQGEALLDSTCWQAGLTIEKQIIIK